jgi:predicted CopG family antitoxin
MRTINISISELEYNKFGLKEDKISFSELIDIISREISRQNLRKSIQLAEKYGLSKMTLEDINKEVKAVRKNAKNNN